MDESLKYDHSNKNYWAERSCGTVYYVVHNGLTFESEDEILQSVTIQMKPTEQYFPVVLFIMLYKVVLTFESVDEILKCDHSNESYWEALSHGTTVFVFLH